uniref:RRM domain-containing protein n=1 Tax=Angiostrongylus cantonensis TaxID=6313 RepID=A0A0K0DQD2_ANGCA
MPETHVGRLTLIAGGSDSRTCVLKTSCSSGEQSDKECPLCMEQLEIDNLDFYPCKCEYQLCRFCWHGLHTDENGLRPACRQPYPEDLVTFKPLSCAGVQRIKDEKRLKQQEERLHISESRNHLSNYRVLQKNLVFVVGLSLRVADPDILRKPQYFGRFGKILKVVVGTAPTANNLHAEPSRTAYVTYSKVDKALKAIQGVCNAPLDGRIVKASLGTTKYCSSFLRSQKCIKPECILA